MASGLVGLNYQRVRVDGNFTENLQCCYNSIYMMENSCLTQIFRSGGLVLMKAVGEFSDYEVFSPIINGIGGNLVSVQASRIATLLHQTSKPGVMPSHSRVFENPYRALAYGTPYAKSSRIFILMSMPGQVFFILLADFIHMSTTTIGAPFILTYLTVSTVQVTLLLFLAHVIIHAMWRFKIDPDSSSIPYLTALGDVIGSCLLLGAFAFLRGIGHEYGMPKV